jgi:Polyketide cyclase / dehydrase and lipid transport
LHGEHSVSINKPASAIFDVIADGTRNATWQQTVVEVSLHSGTGGLGTVWRQVVHGPAGKAADADYRVTTHEPPGAYGFEVIAGPVRGTGLYTLSAGDDGETMVRFEITLKPRGAMRLLTGFVLRQVVDELENLDRLRDLFARCSAEGA